MPDLSTRRQRETEMSEALVLLFTRASDEAKSGGYDPQRFERAVAAAVAAPMAGAFTDAATGMDVNRADAALFGREWADGYARTLAGEIAAGVTAEAALGTVAVAAMLTALVARAERIAATETTRAATSGERYATERFNMETGENMRPTWVTEIDARTCEVCLGLSGTGPEVFARVAPTGPPAHPNCRCFLEWSVA